MTPGPQSIEALQATIVAHDRIVIRGAGTKSARSGDPSFATLELTGLNGIVEYSPDECVFTALAGTPIADIETTLGEHGQYLPFDPVLVRAGATLGGTVACGLSGSCRHRYGGVRDFIIGMRVVDGEGRLIRSGGKVVKNAAGFLLHHAMVGSLGRFAVIAEVTCKVFPRPDARATLRVECGSSEKAWEAVARLQTARRDVEAVDFDTDGNLWVRIAGRAESLAVRTEVLRNAVGGDVMTPADEDRFWSEAGEFAWVAPEESIVKAAGSGIRRLNAKASRVRYFCAGSSAWIAGADFAAIDAAVTDAGLRAQVVRGTLASQLLGYRTTAFETRVHRVLDPHDRFHAASDSRH